MKEVAAMATANDSGFDAQRWASRQLAWEQRERRLAEQVEPVNDEPVDDEHSAAYEDARPTATYGRLRGWLRVAPAR